MVRKKIKKLNPAGFLQKAEEDIDCKWKELPIFQSDRSLALLKVISAADELMRLARGVTDDPSAFLHSMRRAQDGFRFAIPWIFERCPNNEQSLPLRISEGERRQGVELLRYAEAFDTATVYFSQYHEGRFRAYIAKRSPRITFAYTSSEIEQREIEKKAYEIHEDLLKVPRKEEILALQDLRRVAKNKVVSREKDRIELEIDLELILVLRRASKDVLKMYSFAVDEKTQFLGIEYREVKKYWGALHALVDAYEFAHHDWFRANALAGNSSSLTIRRSVDELNNVLAEISEVPLATVGMLTRLFTYDAIIQNLDPITRPLIRANNVEVIVPYAYTTGSNLERNFLRLLAKHPVTARDYTLFSQGKERMALPSLIRLLRDSGIRSKPNAKVLEKGHVRTDVDILAYDPRDGCVLVIQHKWLIEPDSINESRMCDRELARGIAQAQAGKVAFSDLSRLRQLLPQVPKSGYEYIEGLVICKGLEPTGFLDEAEIPVVTERWFVEKLNSVIGLKQLHDRAVSRFDRNKLAQSFYSAKASTKIAGYELVYPVIVGLLEE